MVEPVAPTDLLSVKETFAGEGEDPLIESAVLAENEAISPDSLVKAEVVEAEGDAPGSEPSDFEAVEVTAPADAAEAVAEVESPPVEGASHGHHGIGHLFHFKKKAAVTK